MSPDTITVIAGTGGIDPTTTGGYIMLLISIAVAMVCHLSVGER